MSDPERTIFGHLIEAHPAPTSMDDLHRLVGRIDAEDAVAALHRDGIIVHSDGLLWASRTAVRADELRH